MTTDRFDDRAATWDDDPEHVERAAVVAEALRRAVPLARSMRVLEYGAGTGLVSQALSDEVGPIVLADTSEGMRTVISDKIRSGRLPGAEVWDLDLGAGRAGFDPEFDLIITVMTLHHVPELGSVLENFAALLRPGGHLAVVDLDREDGSFHGDGFGGHHGFDRDDLSAALTTAGFTDVAVRDCHRMLKNDHEFGLFLATARLGQAAS